MLSVVSRSEEKDMNVITVFRQALTNGRCSVAEKRFLCGKVAHLLERQSKALLITAGKGHRVTRGRL